MAYTVTFPSRGPCPPAEEVADWLTEQGEPWEQDTPLQLSLRALPVRVLLPRGEMGALSAHVEVHIGTPVARLVNLLFGLSVRVGGDVRLASVGEVTRPGLWLRLAQEQDRQRLARAIGIAAERGRREEVVRGLWAVLAAVSPDRDVRWDAGRARIVELKEVGAPGGIPVEEAADHAAEATSGDVVALEVEGWYHTVAWRWLSEAHPNLADA